MPRQGSVWQRQGCVLPVSCSIQGPASANVRVSRFRPRPRLGLLQGWRDGRATASRRCRRTASCTATAALPQGPRAPSGMPCTRSPGEHAVPPHQATLRGQGRSSSWVCPQESWCTCPTLRPGMGLRPQPRMRRTGEQNVRLSGTGEQEARPLHTDLNSKQERRRQGGGRHRPH